MVMQSAFFKLASVIPIDEAVNQLKATIKKRTAGKVTPSLI